MSEVAEVVQPQAAIPVEPPKSDLITSAEKAIQSILDERKRLKEKRGVIRKTLDSFLSAEVSPVAKAVDATPATATTGGKTIKEIGDEVTWISQEPMAKGEIAVAILQAGYQSSSTGDAFIASVYNSFIKPYCDAGILVPVGSRGTTKYERTDRLARKVYVKG